MPQDKNEYLRIRRQRPDIKLILKKQARERWVEKKAWLDELKSAPCTDCGQTFPPVCMDWDHLRDKTRNVTRALKRGWSREHLEEELAKCELVCSNCHRIRTQARSIAAAASAA